MPLDANGNRLQAGDTVIIPARVISVNEADDFCNCELEFQHIMPGRSALDRYGAINTLQVEKVFDAGEVAYNGYFLACGGKSLISGAALPGWSDQSPEIREAWRMAARAVQSRGRLSPVFCEL